VNPKTFLGPGLPGYHTFFASNYLIIPLLIHMKKIQYNFFEIQYQKVNAVRQGLSENFARGKNIFPKNVGDRGGGRIFSGHVKKG
jgi:hypothetical protein